MTYRVVLSRGAEKELRRLRDRATRQRLLASIEKLADDPCPPGAVKLQGHQEIWRIRVGHWRICYLVEDDRLVVLILTVGQRGDVYRRLRERLS